ncbi:MAG: hypothetical protein MUC88_01945 [Planctomycetes bacterium]|jgi:hypothetical protein|nr:hypothetical protein [Planctomycetota bacterium]
MSWRSVFLTVAALWVAGTVPCLAQEKLGDLVTSGGYDWIIGRWVATTEEGQKAESSFEWAADQCIVLNGLQVGDFSYQGLVMLPPGGGDAFDEGADSRGGIWKGTWGPEGDNLVRRVEHTSADGRVRKGEIVYGRVDADTSTIAIYAVDDSGARSAEPWNKLTYKRQKDKAPQAPVTAAAARATDYRKLGDLVAEGGYDWMAGQWVASDEGRTYELEFKSILDTHAAQVSVKIGDFKYLGMILCIPSRQEIVDFGADNMGGTWKSTWEQDNSDLLNRIEYTRPDGTTSKMQHVFVKVSNDEMKVRQYRVETDGTRGAPAGNDLTFKRQKPAAPAK